jgi:DNA repair protein RecO (recombination protein O)
LIKTLEGIVIRQTKITGGRRMIQIFTREEGKISAGTHLSERSKGGAALALRPFAHGQYQMSEKRKDMRQISSAETINAHFALGEDADRFAEASYVLEFTDKLLPEGVPETGIFELLTEYLSVLERRKSDFRLLTISYMVKVMQELGVFPDAASLSEGELLTDMNGDILEVMKFIEGQPLKRMEKLMLDGDKENTVFNLIKDFAHRHLDLGMIKSESLFSQGSIDKTGNNGGTNHGNYPRKN